MSKQQESVVQIFAEWLAVEVESKDLGNVPWQRDGILIDTAWWRESADKVNLSLANSAGASRDVVLTLGEGVRKQIADAAGALLAA